MRVVVADDVMLTREGIIRLLTGAGVDVVDIRMPPTHTDEGLVAAQQIRAEHPDIGVLILSQYVEPRYAMRLIEEHPEGVGYLLKERVFDVANLIDALRRLADGDAGLARFQRRPVASWAAAAQSLLKGAERMSRYWPPNADANCGSKPSIMPAKQVFEISAPGRIRTCGPLLRRHLRRVAGRRLASLHEASNCTNCPGVSPGVAWRLPLAAP
jgi:hypothetical protein